MEYYIEYIFAENFILDFILLYITGNLIKKKIIYKRLIAASLIGALYVIIVAMVDKEFVTYFLVKFSVSVLMLMVSYDCKGIIANIRMILCFYIVTLIMVGLVTALYIVTLNKLTVNLIIISMFSGYAILKFFFYEIKSKIYKNNLTRNITIDINNKTKKLKAYIDTGNELTDPLTGKPVIVVNLDSISDMVGEDLKSEIIKFYETQGKNYVNLFLEKGYDLKIRVIKYNTISKKGELMVCIIPDEVTIISNDKNIIKADAIIGINPHKISFNEDYEALLCKKLLDWESETENDSKEICRQY